MEKNGPRPENARAESSKERGRVKAESTWVRGSFGSGEVEGARVRGCEEVERIRKVGRAAARETST